MINSLRVVRAIISKERTDLFNNKKMLIIMFIFPMLYLLINLLGMDEFSNDGAAFVLMHSILVPIQIIASIVAEEKEKGTLRMLILSGVKTIEYMAGILIIVLMFIVFGMIIFDQIGAFEKCDNAEGVLISIIAIIFSMIIGIIIGGLADNQVSVGAISLPVTLIIFFMPVIGMFNEKYEVVGKYIYSGVMFRVLQGHECSQIGYLSLTINLCILMVVFSFVFKSKRIVSN
ncbi:ABC transporter permease [Eubacterium sp.]